MPPRRFFAGQDWLSWQWGNGFGIVLPGGCKISSVLAGCWNAARRRLLSENESNDVFSVYLLVKPEYRLSTCLASARNRGLLRGILGRGCLEPARSRRRAVLGLRPCLAARGVRRTEHRLHRRVEDARQRAARRADRDRLGDVQQPPRRGQGNHQRRHGPAAARTGRQADGEVHQGAPRPSRRGDESRRVRFASFRQGRSCHVRRQDRSQRRGQGKGLRRSTRIFRGSSTDVSRSAR